MPDLNTWLEALDRHIQEADRVLWSVHRLDAAITDILKQPGCPFGGIGIRIQPRAPFVSLEAGVEVSGAPTEVRSAGLDSFGTEARISLWTSPGNASTSPAEMSRIGDACVRLAGSFWKGDLRDAVSWLVSKQNSERQQLIENTLSEARLDDARYALLYCDLDNFKAANDSLGHVEGDRAIREFAALVVQAAGREGIPIHRSGDELLVLAPCVTLHDPLLIAQRLHALVRSHDFRTGGIRIDAKIGIAVADHITADSPYEGIEKHAEAATTYNGERQRGRARLSVLGEAPSMPAVGTSSLELALILLKSGILAEQPFTSPWLNLISSVLFQEALQTTPDAQFSAQRTDELLRWVQPVFDDQILSAALVNDHPVHLPAVFSHMDVAFAVAHAYLRYHIFGDGTNSDDSSLAIRYTVDSAAGELLDNPAKRVLYRWGPQVECSESFELGRVWHASPSKELSEECGRRGVLVKIGHDRLSIPARVFSDIIVVDDRPTRGGGLPDFWESTVARLVAHVESNQNVSAAFLIGDARYASLTAEKLKNCSGWQDDADRLNFRTGIARQSIINVSRRIGHSVVQADSAAGLLPHLAQLYRRHHTLEAIKSSIDPPSGRFLSRHLDASRFSLGKEDGVRARSIAEAFPLVLEISRKADSGLAIMDQAGQQLYELVDFKVHLADPATDMVPTFYAEEKSSLENYFRAQFLRADGLFGQFFHSNGQEATIVQHVASALSGSARPFHTRRGVLIIPHNIQAGQELAPLGLISVRLVPRSSASRRVMNYSFTWRTVEALVGFPYSIYGSVRYAQYLTDQIKSALPSEESRIVEFGYVSYIAHSVHFFLDRYAQNIARRIVEDASE